MATRPSARRRNSPATSVGRGQDLGYAMRSTLDQIKAEVDNVSAANKGTEDQLQSLVNRLDSTEVGLSLALSYYCACALNYNNVYI